MTYTPKQISASDQLIANARRRLDVVLPRMRAMLADNQTTPEPELASLARDTINAIAGIKPGPNRTPEQAARECTEAIANLAMLQVLCLYELAKQPVKVPPRSFDDILGGWDAAIVTNPERVTELAGERYEAVEATLRVEITAAVRRSLYQAVAAGDSGTTTLDNLAEVAVESMSDYLSTHYLTEQHK